MKILEMIADVKTENKISEKINSQRGITLIVLIVTIIILLILASVSIKIVTDNGIVFHTKNALKTYSETEFEDQIGIIFALYLQTDYSGQIVNYKEVVNDILDIFNYPNINEETGELKDPNKATTEQYTITASDGLVEVVDSNNQSLLKIKYDEKGRSIKIYYNGKKWVYENFTLKSKTDIYVEYTGEEKTSGTNEYITGLWKYKKNENGTLTIIAYLGTTEEELKDVTVPNKINGQIVEYFDGFGKNLTGTLTISNGLKTIEKYGGNSKLANIKLSKLVIGEECVLQSGYFFQRATIGTIEIEDNVIMNGDAIFGMASVNDIIIRNNLEIKSGGGNGFCFTIIKNNLTVGDNCKFINNSQQLSVGGKFIIGNNCNINIGQTTAQEISIGKNCTITQLKTCPNLTKLSIGKETIANGAVFNNTQLSNEEVTKALKVLNTIKGQSFTSNSIITEVEIGENSNIGADMFQSCTNLKKLIINNNTTIQSSASFKSLAIEELVIKNNVTFSRSYNMFQGCSKLNKVIIGENSSLTNDFFNSCPITDVEIGKGTTGTNTTFLNCTKIENIKYYLTDDQINKCKEGNINSVISAATMFSRVMGYNTYTTEFSFNKIIFTKQ